MKKVRLISIVLVLCMIVMLLLTGCAGNSESNSNSTASPETEAKAFPDKTITVIVPWPAGGRTDTWIRAIAVPMEKDLGVPVVVANHAGGAGVIGAQAVADSSADGYTLGPFTVAHMMAEYVKNPPFQPDLYEPVAGFTDIPYGIAVKADAPWNTLQEYLDYAKNNPGKIRHGNTGTGNEDHVYIEYLYHDLGIEALQVPYAGDAPAITALLGGEIDVAMMGLPPLMPQVKSGTIKVLAVSTRDRYEFTPDIPTFIEQGVDFERSTWTGFFVPKGTPPEVIERLQQAIEAAVNDPDFEKVMTDLFSPIVYFNTQQLKEKTESTRATLKELVDEMENMGIKIKL
ncbi:MAG: tripartite tricarboxylate transporter substrate binding protein [Dehalobacterium sp.]